MADTRIFKSGGVGRSYETQKGAIYRREWNNIVFTGAPRASEEENVIQFDIRQPLPHSDSVFDAVFLFHIVEHLTTTEAESFLKEIYRILKPSGIVRLSTPDLEDICRAYLNRLEEYDESPGSSNFIKYEWSVLELLDQIARLRSGGLDDGLHQKRALRSGLCSRAIRRRIQRFLCSEFKSC
jgi:SAM-dependent methyltransferase